MSLNREGSTLREQEDRISGRRGSHFEVKFDKLPSKKLVVNQSSFNKKVLGKTSNVTGLEVPKSNEVNELRKVTFKPSRKYSTPTNSEKELPHHSQSDPKCRCCLCAKCNSRSKWNVAYNYLPPTMVDNYLNDPQRTAARFMQLSMVSAVLLIVAVIGIECFMPLTFSREVIISGAIRSFPLHYALAINGLLGFVNAFLVLSLSCRGLLVTKVQQVLYFTVIVPVFGVFCLVYTLGASILFADKLEERMITELYRVGNSSSIWTGSQKFFRCCGIVSNIDWLWNHPFENEINFMFPRSCCEASTVKRCAYNQAVTFRNGCLDSETDFILGISYSLVILASAHFTFELFGWLQIAKLNFRQIFRKKIFQTWIDDKSKNIPCELLSNISNNTIMKSSKKSIAQKPTKRFIGHHSQPHLSQDKKLKSIEEIRNPPIKCSSAVT